MIFRRARVADASAIVGLVKDSFAGYHVQKMIYGCHGIVQFLKDQLVIDEGLCDSSTFVAEKDGNICAVAQFKRVLKSKTLYLNYICTDSSRRGEKLGSRLLAFSLAEEGGAYDKIVLDVFENNAIAKKWYIGLGFSINEEKCWTLIEPEHSAILGGFLSDLPQSSTCQQKYGFSQLTVATSVNTYSVGLLGDKYYRISNGEILKDSAAIAVLNKFDSERVFLQVGGRVAPFDNAKISEFAKTLNMSIERVALQKNLVEKL